MCDDILGLYMITYLFMSCFYYMYFSYSGAASEFSER